MNLLHSITDYILKKGGKFFKGWTREALEDYVAFHIKQGTMCIVANHDDNIMGLIVGWQQRGSEHIPFRWQKTDPIGSHWWIDQYMADDPIAATMATIEMCERFPQVASLPSVAFRRGKIRVYPPGKLLEIFTRAEALYGN